MAGAMVELHGSRLGIDIATGKLKIQPQGASSSYFMPVAVPALVAAGTALSNSTTETALASFTIPANSLAVGTIIKVRFQGIATATTSSDTLALKLYIGATGIGDTTLISIAATDATNNDIFTGEYELVIRTIGASGTMVGVGTFKSIPAAEGTMTIKDDILASTAIDTTVAQVLVLAGTWSAASSSDSCRADIFNISIA